MKRGTRWHAGLFLAGGDHKWANRQLHLPLTISHAWGAVQLTRRRGSIQGAALQKLTEASPSMSRPARPDSPLLEVCIDSVQGAIVAERGGADRVELCANLLEGGTTPSIGMIRSVCAATALPVMVMIRPRGGHFSYTPTEGRVMRSDVEAVRQEGVSGIVIGALTSDGSVDVDLCRELCQSAGSLSVTFHRAFDQTRDAVDALEQLIKLGVDRVLSSGQEPTAWEGMTRLADWVVQAAGRISVMPGCGVRPENARTILERSGAFEIHCSASSLVDNPVGFWRPEIEFRARTLPHDHQRREPTEALVRSIRQAIDK